jgi:C-terminal peptidase prc
MNAPAYPAGSRRPWRARVWLAGLLLIGLLAAAALTLPAAFVPLRDLASGKAPSEGSALETAQQRPPVASQASGEPSAAATTTAPVAPGAAPAASSGATAAGAPASAGAPSAQGAGIGKPADSRAVANQTDVEPGIALITAVYNSIQDRFFRPLDSRDLLRAAWEGARRSLAEQRRPSGGVAAPDLTGDRAGDLQAFLSQYRALLTAAGSGIDPTRVAMATSDVMTQSVGEQHTVFLPPDAFARFRASLTSDQGRVGLGILIQGQTAPFTIGSVVAGAPAEKAGVKDGDVIQAIDGRDVSRLELRDVSEMLRGEEGQAVTLTLRRAEAGAEQTPAQAPAASTATGTTIDVRVVRARFAEPPLTMRLLPEGVCHFRLSTFPVAFVVGPTGRTIGEDLDHYLEQCEQAGGKGWIMDLRGNGGGASISQVLGRFLDAGPILVERDKIGGRYEQSADGHLFRVQRPLVVLIDGNSASASEAFASAVQEFGRGVVMGQRSAGALNTGNIVPLPLNAGMMVAIREVFTGQKEIAVDEVGVSPDIPLSFGRDPTVVPKEAVDAALQPPAGVGPLPPGPSTYEGVLSADELKRRATPVLLRAADASLPENQVERGELAFDTLHYYVGDYPSLVAARARALRLGWQGVYARWIGAGFPPPFAITVSYYSNADGAHKDLREIYEPDEPHNPPQWKEVPSPITLGDETLAQVGTGQNEGRIWISWRRGGTVYTVSQNVTPGDPQSFDEVARLAQIVDERAVDNS